MLNKTKFSAFILIFFGSILILLGLKNYALSFQLTSFFTILIIGGLSAYAGFLGLKGERELLSIPFDKIKYIPDKKTRIILIKKILVTTFLYGMPLIGLIILLRFFDEKSLVYILPGVSGFIFGIFLLFEKK